MHVAKHTKTHKMLFRPFDTNNLTHQANLGLGDSPPSKKSNVSPSKMPWNADLLFRENNGLIDQNSSGFKLDL